MIETLSRPWRRASTWWELVYTQLGFFVATVTFSVVISLLAVTVGLLIVLPLAVPFAWLMFLLARAFGRLERSRLRALLGVEVADPHEALPPGSWWSKLKGRARSRSHLLPTRIVLTTPDRRGRRTEFLVRRPTLPGGLSHASVIARADGGRLLAA